MLNRYVEIVFDECTRRYGARTIEANAADRRIVAWGYNENAALTNAIQRGYRLKTLDLSKTKQAKKVKALKKRALDASTAANCAKRDYKIALAVHMGEILGRDPGIIHGYSFEHFKAAHRLYKKILKGEVL